MLFIYMKVMEMKKWLFLEKLKNIELKIKRNKSLRKKHQNLKDVLKIFERRINHRKF